MQYKTKLIFLFVIIAICSSFLVHKTFAQQETTTTPDVPLVADPTTAAVSAIGLAGAGTALVTSVLNDRKQKKNVKGTDVDFAKALIILSKIFQVCYEIDPNWKKVLDTRATSNVLDKQTLGEAFTHEANGWADFIQESYNVAKPSMGIPQVQNSATETQNPTETKSPDQVPK